MSSEPPVARFTHVTKAFSIRAQSEHNARSLFPRRIRFTAVDDVSFRVDRGEVVGLIGPNGAGKSTVLKLLSRVMSPERGSIVLGGPIASLLEVGAGFHPELTARENVFLNGAILGMSSRHVERQLDAIIEFASVERFLDTPVKRFSSGMRIRLAISVALHLESVGIVLDEVLAVGDAAFQQRCLSLLEDQARSGSRATMLVSHSMATIRQACQRVIVLEKGGIVYDGEPLAGAEMYRRLVTHNEPRTGEDRTATSDASSGLRNSGFATGLRIHSIAPGDDLVIHVDVDTSLGTDLIVPIRIETMNKTLLAIGRATVEAQAESGGRWARVSFTSRDLPLSPGDYILRLSLIGQRGDVLAVDQTPLRLSVVEPAAAPALTSLTVGYLRLQGISSTHTLNAKIRESETHDFNRPG